MENEVKGVMVPKNIFVVIAPDDMTRAEAKNHPDHKKNPTVIETYLETATKNNAMQYAKRLETSHGKCLIGQVIISDLDQVNRPQTAANLLTKENDKLDELIESLDGVQCVDSKRFKILEWVRNL